MPVFVELTMAQRQAVTKKKALAYQGASRKEKSRILEELIELTGWHRDYARAALRIAVSGGRSTAFRDAMDASTYAHRPGMAADLTDFRPGPCRHGTRLCTERDVPS
jgi:hypothetical protein